MRVQKIITKVWQFISMFFEPKDRCFAISIEHKSKDSHTIVKTLYCEGKDNIDSLNNIDTTYLK